MGRIPDALLCELRVLDQRRDDGELLRLKGHDA
jgi:hypothetical protein